MNAEAANPKYPVGTKVRFLPESDDERFENTGVVEKTTPITLVDGKKTFSYVISQNEDIEGEPCFDMKYHVYEDEIVKYFPIPKEGDPEWNYWIEGHDYERQNSLYHLKFCKLLKRKPKPKMKDFSIYYG